jgi:hypothetical protein
LSPPWHASPVSRRGLERLWGDPFEMVGPCGAFYALLISPQSTEGRHEVSRIVPAQEEQVGIQLESVPRRQARLHSPLL